MARGDRDWVVMLDEFEALEDFRQAVTQELAGLENLGHRIGGAYVATPIRIPQKVEREGIVGLPETEYVTIGWAFKQAFAPAARVVEQEPVIEPEAVEAPEAA
jgi:hypothetical protein